MVDEGRKSFNSAGRGSIGRAALGQKELTEKERQERARIKAMLWRDKIRRKFMQARQKLKMTLRRNEAKTERKLATRRKNINPLFSPLTPEFSRRNRCTFTHSTVPKKPKYSLVEPKERIYGVKWRKVQDSPVNMHPAIRKAVEEIKAGIEQKAKIFRDAKDEKTEEVK